MTLDRLAKDQDYVKQVKEQYAKIDKEFEEDEKTNPIPEGLTKPVAQQLLAEKEQLLQKVFTQLQQHVQDSGVDYEQSILMNRTMFDDKMYLNTGFTGKDLQRAIMQHGIYDERLKEAK